MAAVDAGATIEAVDIALEPEGPAAASPGPVPSTLGAAAVGGTAGGYADAGAAGAKTPGSDFAEQELEAAQVRMARIATSVSLAVEGLAAALGLGVGAATGSLSLLGFGGEAALDTFCSAMVLWRFKRPKARAFRDAEEAARFKEARDARRERNSGLGLGVGFVLTAVLLYVSAVFKVAASSAEGHVAEARDGANLGLILSVPLAVALGALAVWKLRLGAALKSQVLWKDGLCSLLGSALAVICAVAALVEEVAAGRPEDMAKVDAVASCIIATILLGEGSRTIWHNWESAPALDHKPMMG